MKKRGFWKELLGGAIKGSLFAFALVFNCVNADVFQLQKPPVTAGSAPVPITVSDAAHFIDLITTNPNTLPEGAINPFYGGPAKMMLGYAVFFPNGGVGAQ